MNKLCAFLCLTLALVLMTGAVMADTLTLLNNDGLTVTIDLKKGDTADAPSATTGEVTRLTVRRSGCADVMVSIAYADTEDTRSMKDMSAQELEDCKAVLLADYPGADILTRTTKSGNVYLLADMHGDYDLHDMFTLYRGFYIELVQYRADFSPLTDKDDAFLLDVLQGIWIREN